MLLLYASTITVDLSTEPRPGFLLLRNFDGLHLTLQGREKGSLCSFDVLARTSCTPLKSPSAVKIGLGQDTDFQHERPL